MAMSELRVFEQTLQKTELWVNELDQDLGWSDKHKTFQGLRAVLHVLRDRLTMGEAANLGAQLPILLAGFYYESWKPENNPTKERTLDAFLEQVRQHLQYYQGTSEAVDPESLVRSVFKLLVQHLPTGEIKDITGILPAPLKQLWPEAVRA